MEQIMAAERRSFEQMWSDLAPVGRSSRSGGYFRQPFTAAEREANAWFVEECEARGLDVAADAFGNTVGCGRQPDGVAPAGSVLTVSHLDSVFERIEYDGPLGVVSALA